MQKLKLMMLGAPGAGKGTQAQKIAEKFNIPHISTGQILREAKKNKTELGLKAQEFMDNGHLVPDDVVIGIVHQRLKEPDAQLGYILDGFPRTTCQAQTMDELGILLDHVLNIVVQQDEIVKRLSGRRTCSQCGALYHTSYSPPLVEQACDLDGQPLSQRKDDTPDVILHRLQVYNEKTHPLIQFYTEKKILTNINGNQSPDLVLQEILNTLQH